MTNQEDIAWATWHPPNTSNVVTSDVVTSGTTVFHQNSYWDPLLDNEDNVLSCTASTRIKRDLMTLFKEPPPGLYVVGDETNMKFVHAIIVGVMDTPYECGFFYFMAKFPKEYPIRPPKVKFLTTDGGHVRFNPNLYKNGKVCLSILGTWPGPSWSPAQQLSTVLLSIQSLLNDKPYFNEPGYEVERQPGDAKNYSEIIRHETLRVAVCGMLENECQLAVPPQLVEVMNTTFLQFYDLYMETAKSKLHLDDQQLIEPFTSMPFTFEYKKILVRLENIFKRLICDKTIAPSLSDSDMTEDEYEEEIM